MKIDLLIFPMHDWKKGERESFRTRDGHLMQEFGRNPRIGKILVVNRPASLPEMLVKRIAWRVRNTSSFKKLGLFSRLSRVNGKTWVLDIFSPQVVHPILLNRDWWHYIFNRRSTTSVIKKALEELNISSPILLLWNPMVTPVIGKFGERLVVFDGIDNWLFHPEISDKRGFIENGYKIIKDRADLIFVNSIPMLEFMADDNSEPVLLNNGVDKDLFWIDSHPVPGDMKNISRPVVGYAGKISKRLDIDLISFLCRELAGVSFVFIGQAINKKWIAPLFRLPNFYYLGDKPYHRLAAYLSGFDIGIIPHHKEKYVIKGDSLKLYEYLAAGKPVVTSQIAGVEKFRDSIHIAAGKDKFLEGIKKYLLLLESGKLSRDRIRNQLPNDCSWDSKADFMLKLITERL